jgi:hypothetical protein
MRSISLFMIVFALALWNAAAATSIEQANHPRQLARADAFLDKLRLSPPCRVCAVICALMSGMGLPEVTGEVVASGHAATLTPIILTDGHDLQSQFPCHGWSLPVHCSGHWKSQGATREPRPGAL